jgi:hypothetical protein
MIKNKKLILFIILSILIGTIYIYPDIRFFAELGNKFKGITLTPMHDEPFYLARLNAVYHGDYRLANIGLYEHRNDPWLTPPYFEVLIGLIGKTLGIPVVYFDIILTFIFPIIIFWLIFLLVSKISDSIYLGILAATSIIMGYFLFSFDSALIKSIFLPPYFTRGLWFMRPFSPQFIYIPFIFSLLAMYLFIDSKTIWKTLIISFAIAMLNYLHIYIWLFMCAGLCVWFLTAVFKKDKLLVKNILFIFFCSTVLAIPFWINYLRVALNPNYYFLEKIFGTEYTHRLMLPFGYIILSIFAVYLNRDLNAKKLSFLISFLIGGLLCLNQQILTGKIIEPLHWTFYTNKTMLLIALIVGLRGIVPKRLFTIDTRIIFYFTILFLFFTGFMLQSHYYNANKKAFAQMQNLSGAIRWLNTHTKKDDVILTESIGYPQSELIRIWMLYTRNYYYLARESHSLVSEEESQYRLLSAMRFFRYTKGEADKIIDFWDGLNLFGMSARYSVLKDTEESLGRIKQKYDHLMSEDPLLLIKRYKVDYVLIEEGNKLFKNLGDIYPFLNKVFDDGFCKIYKFQ